MSAREGDSTGGLEAMVTQMLAAEASSLHLPALLTALTLPDICGALGSENGRASGPKARRWIADWLPHGAERAAGIYGLRCSLLHQGSTFPDDGSPRVIFLERNQEDIHIHGGRWEAGDEVATFIDVPMFVEEVATGVRQWLDAHGATSLVRRNLERFAHRRPNGLSPFISGSPVIA